MTAPLPIDERTDGPVTVLRPRGRLTVETFGQLKDRVGRLIADGCRRMVLNLADVPYADSIGIAEIVRSHVMLRNRSGRLKVSDVSPPVVQLLRLTRLHLVLDAHATEAAAVRSLGSTRTP